MQPQRTCSKPGCGNPHHAGGWCGKHYQWQRVHGDTRVVVKQQKLAPPGASIEERFWIKVDQRQPDDCWPWIGAISSTGYGNFSIYKGRNVAASRFAYQLANGPVPVDMEVCHRCDNPPCCNPGHLFLGTRSDNQMDMVRKGIHPNQRWNRRTGQPRP